MQSKTKKDRILGVPIHSTLVDEYPGGFEDIGQGLSGLEDSAGEMVVSGELGLSGNPVTIVIEDEITGMAMELNHVRNALVLVEDQRKSSSGWLSLVTGNVERVSEVLRFVSKATVDELKRLVKKRK